MIYVIDRIEDGVASLEAEDGRVFELPAELLPAGARGGDVLRVQVMRSGDASLLLLARDADERRRRLEEARAILSRLGARDGGADLDL